MGTGTKGWEWGSSHPKARRRFLYFAQVALWFCDSPVGVAMCFSERALSFLGVWTVPHLSVRTEDKQLRTRESYRVRVKVDKIDRLGTLRII